MAEQNSNPSLSDSEFHAHFTILIGYNGKEEQIPKLNISLHSEDSLLWEKS